MNARAGRTRFGNFELDAGSGTLLRDGRRVRIQPQPLRVLVFLVDHAGRFVSREDLRQAIWDRATFVEFDQGLNYCIRQIRQALGDVAAEPVFIETLKKRGYQFIAPVERIAGPALEPSIAVLPFEDMSAGRDHEWFADGLAEEIINALSRVTGLKVIARTSAFAFKHKRLDIRHIAETLGVTCVLEGSVRKAGDRIRVTAQLISAADGSHLWSDQYDGELTGVFAIQEETAQAIARALKITLSAPSSSRRAENISAYEAYLEARHHYFRLSFPKFKECLDRALALDPNFALANLFCGIFYTSSSGWNMLLPAHEAMPKARLAVQRALELDPALPEAHALLGVIKAHYDFDWSEADRHFRVALSMSPKSSDVLFWYGNHYLLATGRIGEAVDAMTRGLEADPLNLLYRHHLAVGLWHADRVEDAERELRRAVDLDERFVRATATLAAVYAQQGRFDEALVLAEKGHASFPRSPIVIGLLAALLRRRGDTGRAADLMCGLRPNDAYGAPVGLAIFHGVLGELDDSAEWTGRAIEQRFPAVVHLLGPLLSTSSRWAPLARMMRLPVS
jgi:TolB-like protein/Tfp pilus assembly protein PilF